MSRYIDADKLKEFYKPYAERKLSVPVDVILLNIDDMPTEDVQEVKHGRWEPFDLTWGRSVYACTSCGEAFEVPTECGKPMYAFCPYCGARMDEVDEPRYCDRNICASNEVNGIGCDECEVAKYYNLEDDDSPCLNCEVEE